MTDSAPQGFVDLMIEKGVVKDGPQIVGTLRSARRLSASEDLRGPCLHGQVYGDTKGRFRDGDWITTSTIVEELAGGVFRTRYSAYRVESWGVELANDERPANTYDTTDKVRRHAALIAGPLKIAAYTVRDPDTGDHGSMQFHMTYNNTVMAVVGGEAARLFADFVIKNLPDEAAA